MKGQNGKSKREQDVIIGSGIEGAFSCPSGMCGQPAQ